MTIHSKTVAINASQEIHFSVSFVLCCAKSSTEKALSADVIGEEEFAMHEKASLSPGILKQGGARVRRSVVVIITSLNEGPVKSATVPFVQSSTPDDNFLRS